MTKKQYYLIFARQHRAYERKCAVIFYRAIREQLKPVLAHLERNSTLSPDMVNNLVSIEPMRKAFLIAYDIVGVTAALREYEYLHKQEPVKSDRIRVSFLRQIWTDFMRNFALTEAADLVTNITEYTREQIRFALALAAEENLIGVHVAKLIREHTLGKIGRARSLIIARTESTRAANAGKKKGAEDWAKETGTTLYKEWLARLDGHERHSHKVASAETPILSTDKFLVGQSYMDAPGDPSAPAEETVNCRCTQLFMSERRFRRLYG